MTQTQHKNHLVRVYYDGQCGLCQREINFYKKIQPEGVFEWVDLTEYPTELEAYGVSLADSLMHLHVTNRQGALLKGLDSFITIWQNLGGKWSWLAWWANLPGVRHIGYWVYDVFAKWRFGRLRHCQLAIKQNGD